MLVRLRAVVIERDHDPVALAKLDCSEFLVQGGTEVERDEVCADRVGRDKDMWSYFFLADLAD